MKKRKIGISIIAGLLVCNLACILMCVLPAGAALLLEIQDRRYIFQHEEIIGMTSAEVVEEFGEFDQCDGEPDEDGLYRRCRCYYYIIPPRKSFLGTLTPYSFSIHFDENGIAHCYRTEGGTGYVS